MRRWLLLAVAAMVALAMVASGCGSDSAKTTDTGTSTSGAAPAADLGLKTSGKLLVGSDIPYKPFEFTEPGSTDASGFDVDLVKAIAATQGITDVKFQKTAFDTIFTALKQGRFDMVASSVTITPDRAKVIDFGAPYFAANQSVMVAKGKRADLEALAGKNLTRAESLTTLKGLKLGVQRGTTGAELAASVPGASVSQYGIVDDAFNALAAGRVDAVVNDFPASAYATKAKPQLVVVAQIQTNESLGLAFPKTNPKLRDAFDAGLKKIKADGTYAKIYETWFGTKPPAE
jgi:ABC-type amino acid transport substrate-binding protein